jgi:hypothetical protein
MTDREPRPIVGHPSIGPKITAAEWPTWAEIDEIAETYNGDPLMAKILRAAHGGMMHGPSGLKLLYDIRHAMGFSDLHGLSQLAGDIALLRKSYLWGAIEYAPRDGTHVLVKFEGTSSPPTVAHYWSAPDDHGGWFLSVQQYEGPEIHPTHWQRLPADSALATHGGSNG